VSAPPPLILASASLVRARLLSDSGIAHDVEPAAIDEAALKQSLRAEGASTEDAALALAGLKAQKIARRRPGALVIGADQILEHGGDWLDKPVDRPAARAALGALRGQAHELVSGVVVARDGIVLWRHAERASLTMRDFSDDFLDAYLDRVGDAALASVGGYQIEGPGLQLFARIDGDYFTILGLPLLPLLDFLRGHGAVGQ
jgi:septum formation protein